MARYIYVVAPGMIPDHVHTDALIADGKPHRGKSMRETNSSLGGWQLVANQPVEMKPGEGVPGKLGIGRLVSGQLVVQGRLIGSEFCEVLACPGVNICSPAGPTILRWLATDVNKVESKPDMIG